MKYRITIALVATDEGHLPFGLDTPGLVDSFGDSIVAAFPWHEPFEVEAESVHAALGELYREGNIGGEGWAARYREGRQRSISVGDVAIVDAGGELSHWQVLSCGWDRLDDDLARSIMRESPWSFEVVDAARR